MAAWPYPVKPLLLFLLMSLSASAIDVSRLADAIYKAEGGAKTRFPYGVKSVQTHDPRGVCIRTIRRALKDWPGKGDFILFLGKRYCPVESDPVGHRNWVRNVRKIYDERH